jgi:hypothetical protein
MMNQTLALMIMANPSAYSMMQIQLAIAFLAGSGFKR